MNNKQGYSLVELMATVTLLLVVSTAGFILFTSGSALWSVVDSQITIQENARTLFQRLGFELHESGRDQADILQVWITNNGGPNNTDILRFSIPICLCGQGVIDENGDVRTWGAPLSWGSTGCTDNYALNQQGKVDICHIPPGNPNNEHSLSVGAPSVKAHLAHGDRLGDCDDCDPNAYSNKYIEYRINGNNQVIRRVLTSGFNEVRSDIIASGVSDFQTALTIDNKTVSISVNMNASTLTGRVINYTRSEDFILRNYE